MLLFRGLPGVPSCLKAAWQVRPHYKLILHDFSRCTVDICRPFESCWPPTVGIYCHITSPEFPFALPGSQGPALAECQADPRPPVHAVLRVFAGLCGFWFWKWEMLRAQGSRQWCVLLMCTPTNAVESISYSLQMFTVIMIQHLHLRTLRFERELVKGRAELDNLALKAIQEDWRVTWKGDEKDIGLKDRFYGIMGSHGKPWEDHKAWPVFIIPIYTPYITYNYIYILYTFEAPIVTTEEQISRSRERLEACRERHHILRRSKGNQICCLS